MKENYKSLIDSRVKTIARLTMYPTSREQAISENQPKFLAIDNYHGYKLILISVETGAEYTFSFRHTAGLSAPAFVEMLDGMIFGLEYGRK